MSLKAFHIVFIIFSTLLAFGTGAWCVWVDLIWIFVFPLFYLL